MFPVWLILLLSFMTSEIHEEPYRIDGYLTQLHLNGIFDHLSGFVFGR